MHDFLNSYIDFISLIPYIFIFIAIIYDLGSFFIRVKSHTNVSRQILGFSSVLQYLSRILFILSAMLLVLCFELGVLELNLNPIGYSIFFGTFIFSILMLKKYVRFMFLETINFPINYLLFRDVNLHLDFYKLKERKLQIFWIIIGIFMQTILLTSIFLPIILEPYFNELKMSLPYFANMINFIFTLIIIGFVEPKIFKELDDKNHKLEGSQTFESTIGLSFFSGKILGSVIYGVILIGI